MCIVLVTRTKKYTIFLSNRDEFLARPTTRASFWPEPHSHILAARDMARPVHGTWLGVTRTGRIAVLTNYREDTEEGASAAQVSRGEITKEFLLSEKPIDEWLQETLTSGVYKNCGGFSLLCGVLKKNMDGFAIVSNRSSLTDGVDYVLQNEGVLGYECEGLSNALFHEEWPKVKMGKELLRELTEKDVENEDEFIERCFALLSTNSFAATPTVDTLRESIFIPKWVTPALPSLPADETHAGPEWARTDHNRWYGTREQTVILISHEDGRVVFTERTLWDEAAQPLSIQDGETRVVFHIEGWET